jgi:cysteinyl-tRNA synthetase
VLGLDLDRAGPEKPLPVGAERLLAAREKARAAKDFAKSDELRDQLAGMGVSVIDTPNGQRIKR